MSFLSSYEASESKFQRYHFKMLCFWPFLRLQVKISKRESKFPMKKSGAYFLLFFTDAFFFIIE